MAKIHFSEDRYPSFRRSVLLAALVTAVIPIVMYDERPPRFLKTGTWYTRLHDVTLVYYRAPEHASPPINLLDPYDCFQKEDDGDLIIAETTKTIHSSFASGEYRGYALRSNKGNPVIVYQITPTRRERTKSNCHGFTFLGGDYWMLSDEVERILADDHWTPVPREEVQPGDIAIYREGRGAVVHSARVVGRDEKDHILVDSKDGFDRELRGVWAERVIP